MSTLTINQTDGSVVLVTAEQGPAGPPGDVSSDTIDAIEQITQAAFDALGTPDATTLYVIVG